MLWFSPLSQIPLFLHAISHISCLMPPWRIAEQPQLPFTLENESSHHQTNSNFPFKSFSSPFLDGMSPSCVGALRYPYGKTRFCQPGIHLSWRWPPKINPSVLWKSSFLFIPLHSQPEQGWEMLEAPKCLDANPCSAPSSQWESPASAALWGDGGTEKVNALTSGPAGPWKPRTPFSPTIPCGRSQE